jgi:hypothetical protein
MMAGGDESMLVTTRTWLDGLREFSVEHRLRKPLSESAASAARAAERMILAANLATALAGWEEVLAGRRAEQAGGPDLDSDPAVVITTSPGGIAVADEQLATGSLPARSLAAQAVAVTELEYRLWCIRQPDDGHRLHVNLWNWIKTSVPPQRHAEFARHPLREGEAYWLHRTGIAGAGRADRRDCHLWKWNGRHASLVEAFVTERGVSELS